MILHDKGFSDPNPRAPFYIVGDNADTRTMRSWETYVKLPAEQHSRLADVYESLVTESSNIGLIAGVHVNPNAGVLFKPMAMVLPSGDLCIANCGDEHVAINELKHSSRLRPHPPSTFEPEEFIMGRWLKHPDFEGSQFLVVTQIMRHDVDTGTDNVTSRIEVLETFSRLALRHGVLPVDRRMNPIGINRDYICRHVDSPDGLIPCYSKSGVRQVTAAPTGRPAAGTLAGGPL